jgi:hypothetical protein
MVLGGDQAILIRKWQLRFHTFSSFFLLSSLPHNSLPHLPSQRREFKNARWVRVSEFYQLRIEINGGAMYKFDGFRSSDQQKVSEFLKSTFGLDVLSEELCTNG